MGAESVGRTLRGSSSMRWAIVVALVATLGVAAALLFLLSLSTTGLVSERHFVWLFWVNVGAAALLATTIVIALARLAVRLRRGKFGSRLLAKFAGVVALVAVLPGALVYAVSWQFVGRSMDLWFDREVASALDAGLALGRTTLEAAQGTLVERARDAAQRLAAGAPSRGAAAPASSVGAAPAVAQGGMASIALALERVRAQSDVEGAALLDAQGRAVAATSRRDMRWRPGAVAPALLARAQSDGAAAAVEGLDDEPASSAPPAAQVIALARLDGPRGALLGGDAGAHFVLLQQPLAAPQVAQALAVQRAYREYQQRALSQQGLRRMVLGTLTLALVLAVFGAVLLAATLGNQIVRPLLLVAKGVREVAEGDLTPKQVFASHDELGGLTRSFAAMTAQLADARAEVERGVAQLEGARTRLQTILDSLSAGVLVLDPQGRLQAANPGATRILRQPVSAWVGQPLRDVPTLGEFADQVLRRMELHLSAPEAGERDHWQDAFVLPVDDRLSLNLIVRGALLPGDERLIVFDDITEVVSAQRAQAWAEVARRVAHEIKNPLTPIQLSAERLAFKLEAKLADEADRAMLQRSVHTIVTQVQSMKTLVDAFRDYARLPTATLAPLSLNALVRDVMALYSGAQESGRLELALAPALPGILGDASQLRQVIHNLVQNALDATEPLGARGLVQVSTEAMLEADGTPRGVRLRVRDNGAGFPDHVLKRPFEPYVTTKTRGTGLGLAVVKKIADEHAARVRLANGDAPAAAHADAPGPGAQVSLSFSRLAPAPEVAADPAAPVALAASPPSA